MMCKSQGKKSYVAMLKNWPEHTIPRSFWNALIGLARSLGETCKVLSVKQPIRRFCFAVLPGGWVSRPLKRQFPVTDFPASDLLIFRVLFTICAKRREVIAVSKDQPWLKGARGGLISKLGVSSSSHVYVQPYVCIDTAYDFCHYYTNFSSAQFLDKKPLCRFLRSP